MCCYCAGVLVGFSGQITQVGELLRKYVIYIKYYIYKAILYIQSHTTQHTIYIKVCYIRAHHTHKERHTIYIKKDLRGSYISKRRQLHQQGKRRRGLYLPQHVKYQVIIVIVQQERAQLTLLTILLVLQGFFPSQSNLVQFPLYIIQLSYIPFRQPSAYSIRIIIIIIIYYTYI